MADIKKSVVELIGKTPLMEVTHYAREHGVTDARLLVKLEYLNPAGSVKDRVALHMIEEAEGTGRCSRVQRSSNRLRAIRESAWRWRRRRKDMRRFSHYRRR